MNQHDTIGHTVDLDLAAASWQVRRQDGLTTQEEAQFQAWLASNAMHRPAYARMEGVWSGLGELHPAAVAQLARAMPARKKPAFSLPRLATAALAMGVLGAGWLGWNHHQRQPVFHQSYASARGELLDVHLPDGSVMKLDTATHVEVTLYRQRREVRLQSNSYDGTQEPFGLERVEVLRGAASVLYGQLSPGGVINAVSKRPGNAPVREVQLQTGSHDRKQLAVDVGGKVPGSDTLDYRLTMLDRKSNTSQDYLNDDKLYIAPALTWRPSAATALTILSFYQKTATRFSAPLSYQLVEGVGTGPVRIGREAFIGEPDYDKMKGDMHAIGYEFEHRFSDRLKLSHKLRYFEADVSWNHLQAQTTVAAIRNASERGLLARRPGLQDGRRHRAVCQL